MSDGTPDFRKLFGRPPEIVTNAPGRVNLIGEHTDYNGGFVMPLAIPQRTYVELARRSDRCVRATSANMPGYQVAEYELGGESRGRGWVDYVQGVTHTLARTGYHMDGFDVRIVSSVPVGSGLASSAALEIALLRALRSAFGLPIDDLAMARAGQRAENEFVGAPVGIMDQMAGCFAGEQHALFLDARSLEFERVALPLAVELAVIDSGIAHAHAAGEYRVRRHECEQAAAQLGVMALRDVTAHDLARCASLSPPLDRRARHVVTENARVLAAREAMREEDERALGKLLDASHASMRDDFGVSTPLIDRLVELARRQPQVLGARLTGGGFGGCIVVLAASGTARASAHRVVRAYRKETGLKPAVIVPPS